MAKRKRKRKYKSRQSEYPPWIWMVFGLALGLSVALAIFVNDRTRGTAMRPVAREPASMAEAAPSPIARDKEVTVAEKAEPRFTFYEDLPNFEVIVPEHETHVSTDSGQLTVVEPGLYVLQAGSFSRYADADRRRATLAMQGIESAIQRVTIDDKTYHRVRIGPISDLDKLNVLRARLRAAKIDVLRIKLGG